MEKTKQLLLTIVSQEKQLLSVKVDSITAPASQGEVTILPDHISMFTRLDPGILIYRIGQDEHSFVVSNGFLDVNEGTSVTVIVDTATAARDISLVKAQQAIEAAKETMSHTTDRRELLMAEASLKQAMLEVKIAQKTRKSSI
jgi:F-type H+-transporting ATPase subunit epsilon